MQKPGHERYVRGAFQQSYKTGYAIKEIRIKLYNGKASIGRHRIRPLYVDLRNDLPSKTEVKVNTQRGIGMGRACVGNCNDSWHFDSGKNAVTFVMQDDGFSCGYTSTPPDAHAQIGCVEMRRRWNGPRYAGDTKTRHGCIVATVR